MLKCDRQVNDFSVILKLCPIKMELVYHIHTQAQLYLFVKKDTICSMPVCSCVTGHVATDKCSVDSVEA